LPKQLLAPETWQKASKRQVFREAFSFFSKVLTSQKLKGQKLFFASIEDYVILLQSLKTSQDIRTRGRALKISKCVSAQEGLKVYSSLVLSVGESTM
jgi:hypothetical protein